MIKCNVAVLTKCHFWSFILRHRLLLFHHISKKILKIQGIKTLVDFDSKQKNSMLPNVNYSILIHRRQKYDRVKHRHLVNSSNHNLFPGVEWCGGDRNTFSPSAANGK